MRISIEPALDRPMMVFDGDCNFCRCWIGRWQQATGERIEYAEYQKVGGRFAGIPETTFTEAVQLIEPNGDVTSGADAIFRLFDYSPRQRPVLSALRNLPGFMPLARAVYRVVARNRRLFSMLTRAWCRREHGRAA